MYEYEYSVIPKETILAVSLILTIFILMIQCVRRKWNIKKYVGSIIVYSISEVYVYNILGDVSLGGAKPFDDNVYSKVPFGNLLYDYAQFDESILWQYQRDFFVFFAITITFFILFGCVCVYFYEIKSLKMFYWFSLIFFELIQFMIMQLSYRFLISKRYPLVFDTGAFILVPLCLAIGIIIGNTLRGNVNDRSKKCIKNI